MSESQKYNRFTFCPDDYQKNGSHADYFPEPDSVDWDAMWADFGTFVRLAIKNGYQCHLWFDGYTLVVDYNYSDQSISGVSLEWIGENEYVECYTKPSDSDEDEEHPIPVRKETIPVSWIEDQVDNGKWDELVRRWNEYISRVPDEMLDSGPAFEWDSGKGV